MSYNAHFGLTKSKFITTNLVIIILLPVLAILSMAGMYIGGLVIGIIALIALVIVAFLFIGPGALIILLVIALIFGGVGAAINAIGYALERVMAFLTYLIPTLMYLGAGVLLCKDAKEFDSKATKISAIITAILYFVAGVTIFVSAIQSITTEVADGISGVGFNNTIIFFPSVTRIFYTFFGAKELI